VDAGVVVVGAGPAGLAVAATLRQHDIPVTLLEARDRVGASWAGRYDSLRLHTVRWLSGLPGAPMPRAYGKWVARDDVVAYLESYADRFDVRPELGVAATRVDREDGGWRVDTSDGPRRARAVVIATGYSRTPYLPDWPGTFDGSLLHASDYREPSSYRGRHVLLVGAGNSAAEIALDLVGVGARVDLSVRTPPNIVRRDTLGVPSQLFGIALKPLPERVVNPLVALLRRISVPDLTDFGLPAPGGDGFTQFLRTRTVPILDHGFVAAVRRGDVTVVPQIARLDGTEVELVDGRRLRPDVVLAATGYRADLDGLVGHLGVLDDRGMPRVHGERTLVSAPGLHFVGITVELSGLLREIGLEARGVGRALAQSLAAPALAAGAGAGRAAS
jgi:putative flavoprotein involved in K+ transport